MRFGNIAQIEILYRKYIKILQDVANFNHNVMVYGETGTIVIMNHVKSRMMNLYEICEWYQISKLSPVVLHI